MTFYSKLSTSFQGLRLVTHYLIYIVAFLVLLHVLLCLVLFLRSFFFSVYKGADESLARPGRKQATATEDFEFHISYL